MTNTVLAGQTLTDGLLGIPVWTPMSLQNSWSNAGGSYVTAQYRLWELINEVEIIGRIGGGTISAGTVITTLPYTPASVQELPLLIASGATALVNYYTPLINVLQNGNLQIYNVPTNTTVIAFHDWISLDA